MVVLLRGRLRRLCVACLCVLVMGMGAGCAPVISKSLRQQADTTLSFAQLRADPHAYIGRLVILGGELVRTRVVPEGTLLEVVQKPLSRRGRPLFTDHTAGRFMARCKQFLDPAVYAPGRQVTVAGRVLGVYKGRLGDIEYTYPLVSCLEIHLWPQVAPPQRYLPYPWWYWRPFSHPFWHPWHPYW